MNRRRRKLKPSSPWGVRVDALIRACGWPQKEWHIHFCLHPSQLTKIRYHGARPRTSFVITLRKLEGAHAQELEAMAQGLIQFRGDVRVDWRSDEEKGGFRRPEDLRGLG